jgi:hypothetical protein
MFLDGLMIFDRPAAARFLGSSASSCASPRDGINGRKRKKEKGGETKHRPRALTSIINKIPRAAGARERVH